MKAFFKNIALVSLVLPALFLEVNASTSGLKVKKETHLGPMKNKVIFQSQDLKKTKSKSIYTGKLVAKWGEHVYEVVKGSYECKKSVCELIDYSRIATFELCKVNKQTVSCSNKISGELDSAPNENTEIVYENVDEVSDRLSSNQDPDDSVDYSDAGTGSVYDEFGDLYN